MSSIDTVVLRGEERDGHDAEQRQGAGVRVRCVGGLDPGLDWWGDGDVGIGGARGAFARGSGAGASSSGQAWCVRATGCRGAAWWGLVH